LRRTFEISFELLEIVKYLTMKIRCKFPQIVDAIALGSGQNQTGTKAIDAPENGSSNI
jgi:hypothetical protein